MFSILMFSHGMASGHITLDLWTQLKKCVKKRIMSFMNLHVIKKEIMLLKLLTL